MKASMLTVSSFLLLLLFTGCEKEQELEQFSYKRMESYAGLTLLHTAHFREDSLIFKMGPSGLEIDTVTQLLKRVAIGTYNDYEGDKTWVVGYLRKPWESASEWTSSLLVSKAIKGNALHYHENNHSIIKLIFPPSLNKRWNGLSLFNPDDFIIQVRNEPISVYKDWTDFRVIKTGETLTIGDMHIHDVITILQVDMENAIERRYSVEKFAPDIGLVYREQIILDTQNISNAPWEEKAERGYILRWELLSF